ncbi:MAG: DinB family protein [Chloroflexi bacterium]|nr:DinB family protein [Chloroflexota bacterium]
MDWNSMVLYGYESVAELLAVILRGLSVADLNVQPHPDCNSIGWTVWHLTRLPDDVSSSLLGEDQLWTAGGWHKKFKMPADPMDSGYGHTPEQVRAFRSPGVKVQMAYHNAVLERMRRYIKSLQLSDLSRTSDLPWSNPNPTLGQILQDVLSDCWLHTGEASYIRGLLKAEGRI